MSKCRSESFRLTGDVRQGPSRLRGAESSRQYSAIQSFVLAIGFSPVRNHERRAAGRTTNLRAAWRGRIGVRGRARLRAGNSRAHAGARDRNLEAQEHRFRLQLNPEFVTNTFLDVIFQGY